MELRSGTSGGMVWSRYVEESVIRNKTNNDKLKQRQVIALQLMQTSAGAFAFRLDSSGRYSYSTASRG